MNAFFSFDLFMIYIPECTQQLRNNTRRYEILHTLYLGWEPCNNQRPRCDIACLHVTNHYNNGFPG